MYEYEYKTLRREYRKRIMSCLGIISHWRIRTWLHAIDIANIHGYNIFYNN